MQLDSPVKGSDASGRGNAGSAVSSPNRRLASRRRERAEPTTVAPRKRRLRSRDSRPICRRAPLAVILGFFLLLPILLIVVVSFWDYDFAADVSRIS